MQDRADHAEQRNAAFEPRSDAVPDFKISSSPLSLLTSHAGQCARPQPGAEGMAPKPQGMLFVRICGASDIPRFDWKSMLSKPDTYVTCASVPSATADPSTCRFANYQAARSLCDTAKNAA